MTDAEWASFERKRVQEQRNKKLCGNQKPHIFWSTLCCKWFCYKYNGPKSKTWCGVGESVQEAWSAYNTMKDDYLLKLTRLRCR